MITRLCLPGAQFRGVHPVFSAGVRRTGFRSLRAVLALVAAVLVFQPLGHAQQQSGKEPFIEPAEMHSKTKARALIATQPHVTGQWATLPFMMPLNPVHIAMMHNGKVLIVSGSGNDPNDKILQAGVWDPKTATIKTFLISYDMFCNGMIILPNGQPFVLGGTLKYDSFLGYAKTSLFNPATEVFTSGPDMSGGRWYPTATVLGDGSVMVLSGLLDTSSTLNTTVQIGNGVTWTAAGTIFGGAPLYPREHLLPDGKVFEDGSNPDSQMYDPVAHTFTPVATTIFGKNREYGTSVLLPLTPANGFKPKVMIMGGGEPPLITNTTELIDLSVPSPKWVSGPAMVGDRIQLNATILPSGQVLVSGGSTVDEDPTTGVLEAQLYHPATNTFTSAGNMEFARVYHSNTMLLPDGTVMAVGGNPTRGDFEPHIEIYSPPYLFKTDGTLAKRPVITKVTPTAAFYGSKFSVSTPDAASIKSVVLVRAGAVTHAFDMEQRLVGLSFKNVAGVLQVTAPAKGNLAPPGYYLLFIVDDAGVPSVAQFIHLSQLTAPRKR
ncbi:MAG TPA: galactose oxidase-like domain-containing protein [Candidatus Angelobacter sp.]